MTVRWYEIPAAEKNPDLIQVEMRLLIKRSSQWSWTWVEKLTCCLGSKHVRIPFNLLACPFELPRCKLKSPIVIEWSLVNLEINQNLTCRPTVLKPIQVDKETTERMVSDTCRDRFERFKWCRRWISVFSPFTAGVAYIRVFIFY